MHSIEPRSEVNMIAKGNCLLNTISFNRKKLSNCNTNSGTTIDPRSRPKMLAMGRDAVANVIKIVAITNQAIREQGGREFCVLPSYHASKDTRKGHEGKDVVHTRIDLFAA